MQNVIHMVKRGNHTVKVGDHTLAIFLSKPVYIFDL